MPDDFIFLDKARHITVCFFNRQTCKATYWPIVVYIRNYKWKSDSYIQGNEKSGVTVAALCSKALIHLKRSWLPSTSTGLWLFQSAQASGTSEGLISTYRALQMNWSRRSPELSATHIAWELHSSTHFPCEQQVFEKKKKKTKRNVAKLFSVFFLVCWISMWHRGTKSWTGVCQVSIFNII